MNKFSFYIFGLLLIGLTSFSSCKEDDDPQDPNNPPTTNTDPTQTYSYEDAFGVLAAIKSVSYTTAGGYTVPVELATAVAVFMNSANASTFVDAGTVQLNSKALTRQTNNSYAYQDVMNPITLNQVQLTVSGSSSVPSFSQVVSKPIPDYSGFSTLPATITRANGLEVNLSGAMSNADSVLVVLASGSGVVYKTVAGNASKVSFSASELSALPASQQGMLQVSPRNMTTETISSKKYYFVNQATYTKMPVTVN